MSGFVIGWIVSIPQTVTPLLLASLGLILCEREGVLNLGAEGLMSVGALTAAVAVLNGTGPWIALALGAGASVVLSALLGVAVVLFRAEQTLAGLATVALAWGSRAWSARPMSRRASMASSRSTPIWAMATACGRSPAYWTRCPPPRSSCPLPCMAG